MRDEARRYWVLLIVDNSISKTKPTEEGLLPMHMNAAPLIKPAEDGEDILCVFTTERRALSYGHAAVDDPASPAAPGALMPLDTREDFEQVLGGHRVPYAALDPEYGGQGGGAVSLDEFLDGLE